MQHLWHAFADMHTLDASGPLVIARGEGIHVWDAGGRRYLDATASLWYCNVGFGRDELADAAAEQLRTLAAYSTFGDLTNAPAENLADRVSALSPVPDSRVFLTSGGSDSIDTAAKMARRYWQLRGEPERTILVGRSRAYHGMHLGGTSLAGIEANAEGHGTFVGEIARVAWDDPDALRATIEEHGAGRIAAFFCEPVIGAGGVFAAPDGYLSEVRRICRDHDVLFVADEVITGFGRAGEWFASSRWDLDPDLITCAKGITSGYLPMGAVIAAPRVYEPFAAPGAGMWRHGYTYSGHATVAAVALANIAILEREELPARALQLEKQLEESLAPLADHERVEEVRSGTGVLAAVQPTSAALADPSYAPRLVAACREAGVITRTLATGALQVSPALVIDQEGLEELTAGIAAALERVAPAD